VLDLPIVSAVVAALLLRYAKHPATLRWMAG
jgi:hypothetical protein